MLGYIQGQTIILTEPLPENFFEGEEVEVVINIIPKQKFPFPTSKLGIKDEYLKREKIYEQNQDIL